MTLPPPPSPPGIYYFVTLPRRNVIAWCEVTAERDQVAPAGWANLDRVVLVCAECPWRYDCPHYEGPVSSDR